MTNLTSTKSKPNLPEPKMQFVPIVLEQGPELLASTAVILLLLFYLLAYGDTFVDQSSSFIMQLTGLLE